MSDAAAWGTTSGIRWVMSGSEQGPGLGKLYRRTGKREQARGHLTAAATMYREMDTRSWLEQAEAELMELGT
jgi:hypothetical protein